MDVDHGQLIGRRLEDIAVVMSLEKLAPVGGWTAVGCDRWRLKRSAKMGQNLADWARLRDDGDEPDVAAAVRALEWKLLRVGTGPDGVSHGELRRGWPCSREFSQR